MTLPAIVRDEYLQFEPPANQWWSIDFNKAEELSKDELQKYIVELENYLLSLPQVEVHLKHHFANAGTSKGVYGREIKIDKNTLIVGAFHKFETLNIISGGKVTVISIDGVNTLEAPYTFTSSPGAKRVIFAHEDTIWTTLHSTPETEIEKIEQEFVTTSLDEIKKLSLNIKELECLSPLLP